MNEEKEFQCEIKDTMESVQRFLGANNSNVIFVGALVAFKDKEQTKIKKNTGAMFAFGNKGHLRNMLNDLRDTVEDSADENEFINI